VTNDVTEFDLADIEAAQPAVSEETARERVSRVCIRLAQQERDLADMEEKVKLMKESVRSIKERELPAMLGEMGFDSVTTTTGACVTIKKTVHCALPKEDPAKREAAMEWLRSNGHGDVIKHLGTVKLPKGDSEARNAFMAHVLPWARANGAEVSVSEDVHPSTLKSLIGELHGSDPTLVPRELFQLYDQRVAEIDAKKGSKGRRKSVRDEDL